MYSTSPGNDRAILHLVGDLVQRIATWEEFQARVLRSPCAVIVIDHLNGSSDLKRIEKLTRKATLTRFLLVIEDSAVNDDLLGRLAVARVVRLSRAVYQLNQALLELLRPEDLAWIPAALSGRRHMRPTVQRALKVACLNLPPVPSISELASGGACPRETLSRDWRAGCGDRLGLKLHEFMNWIVLLWACLLRPGSRNWYDVATRMDVGCSTLANYAKELARHSLRELDEAGEGAYDRVRQIFTDEVLKPLTAD